MSQVRRTPGSSGPRGVVYDLAERRRQSEAAAETPRTDQSGVSQGARELARAQKAVDAAPEVRAERIAELKAQIAKGTYKPDPKEVAKRLLERGF